MHIFAHPRFRKSLVSGVALVVAVAVTAVAVSWRLSGGPTTESRLRTHLKTLLRDPRLASAQSGADVRDARTGKTLFAKDPTKTLIPGSNQKLLTTAAALEVLGPGHRFSTRVLATAKPGHRMDGDLFLQGTGDPSIRPADYDALAGRLASFGIKEVAGRLVADDTWFDGQRLGSDWDVGDESSYDSAQISALTVSPDSDDDAGSVMVEVDPGANRPQVRLAPDPGKFFTVVNRTTRGHGPTNITMQRERGGNRIVVAGEMAAGAPPLMRPVSVWDPTRYATALFRKALTDHGIRVGGPTVEHAAPPGARQLASHESAPLSSLVVPLLKRSNSTMAEVLVKSMGQHAMHQGTWAAGLATVSKFLTRMGIRALRLRDGSGLSSMDAVSPREITTLLFGARRKPWFGTFHDALPVAGNPDRMIGGTLADRMRNGPAAGRVNAKTGTLTGVSCLSGYVTTSTGKPLVFSLMINGLLTEPPKDLEDAFADRLAAYSLRG
ncbi:D-alanyl-D-alanine carboxypeptidase/D-alanyl-D-alanine endopeptidase [Actinomadura montaniterrae]|uniref:D-alanyl-D-alanine carboxypeptidase/D-alanyl-D-alanine endopeptidase n=1 Tax=Actinomadura montaniterrae TaxID=1803903 RepID=UPI00178C39F8|nr:D-alanyl-D-alanine carboxypeptidase/D-alanyl-D-alanine-endopeptidase [Actinomadura montaniterrae]